MYAVVKTGGREYRVSKGDLIRVEKLEGNVGDQVELKEVLMVSKEGEAQFGTPIWRVSSSKERSSRRARERKS